MRCVAGRVHFLASEGVLDVDGDGGAVEEAACSGGGLAGDEVREFFSKICASGGVLFCRPEGQ